MKAATLIQLVLVLGSAALAQDAHDAAEKAPDAVVKGIQLRDARDYEGAITEFAKAVGLDANYAEAYWHRGVVLSYLKRYDDSMRDLDKAISLAPKDSRYYAGRGEVYHIVCAGTMTP